MIWHMPGKMWTGMLKAAPVTVWQRFGGAVVITMGVAATYWIIWKGPWPTSEASDRLDWIGLYGVLLILALIICIVALFDFQLAFKASRTGIEATMKGDDPLATVTTTTTVEGPTAQEKP